ncbi:MAG: hypothetical protein CFK52_04515 [Chloracidobacterium sp. CP2_5A]|nr:MAG: hypothetical protein CFK52_04515 [Chloracidobacterium sp. CP2_5A]
MSSRPIRRQSARLISAQAPGERPSLHPGPDPGPGAIAFFAKAGREGFADVPTRYAFPEGAAA